MKCLFVNTELAGKMSASVINFIQHLQSRLMNRKKILMSSFCKTKTSVFTEHYFRARMLLWLKQKKMQ